MKIKLSKSLASNSAADEFDVKQVKKALNRLGYYQPYEKTGITGIPDTALFSALKSFQKDQGLRPTSAAKPNDETVQALNQETAKTTKGQYIWRTIEDSKVRKEHAQYNRTLRSWADSPDPGEDFGCRCWAEPVKEGYFLPPKGLKLETTDCDQKKEEILQTQKKVKDLSETLNTLLLELNELVNQNNDLILRTQKSLGIRFFTYLLTLPSDRLGVLGDLLTRYFEGIISKELIEGADNFIKQRKAIEYEIAYKKGQFSLVFVQLETAASKLEEARKRYEMCK